MARNNSIYEILNKHNYIVDLNTISIISTIYNEKYYETKRYYYVIKCPGVDKIKVVDENLDNLKISYVNLLHNHNEPIIDKIMHSPILAVIWAIVGLSTMFIGIRDYRHHKKCHTY